MRYLNSFKYICTGCLLLITYLASSAGPNQDGQTKEQKDTVNVYTNAITVNWIGIVFHPLGGTYPDRYIRKLDPNAYFVIEHGVYSSFEHRLFERTYLKSAASLFIDCANLPAGFLHLGVHFNLLNKQKHIVSLGLGPTLLFREDWHQFPEYVGDEFFKDRLYGKWQYRFIIFGDIEYNYRFSKNTFLNISLFPGGRYLYTLSFGLKHTF